MSVTHVAATRNALANAIAGLVDAGSGDATGDLTFVAAGDAVICTCNFANPSFGAPASGVITANAIAMGTVGVGITSQTVIAALLRNRANAEVLRCAVAVSGSDINLTSVVFSTNDTITISDLSYAAPT